MPRAILLIFAQWINCFHVRSARSRCKPEHNSGKDTVQTVRSSILIRGVFSEFLIDPAAPVTTAPDFSKDQAACNRAARNDDSPEMPHLRPRGRWAQIEQSVTVGGFGIHAAAGLEEQSRQAEYDRMTALPVWARALGGKLPGALLVAYAHDAATKLAN